MTISAMSPHPFTLRQLQYVLAVADLLSFRRAAEACHVSQPSLSTQIQQVEDGLGVRLFERDRRRVLLTPAGHAVVERARRVVQEADALVAAATQAGDPLNGTLRIGVIPTVSPYLLPSAAPALRKAHPRLTTIWVEDKTEALVTALDAGSLDGALLALEAELGDVEHDTVAIDPFVLAAAPGDPLLERAGAMTPRALKGASILLLDDGHCFRSQALSVCHSAGAQELAFRATSLPTLAQMVASGAGVTLLPACAVATEAGRAGLDVREFAAPAPHRTIVLAWRRRSPLEAGLRRLAATLRESYPGDGAVMTKPKKGRAAAPRRRDAAR